MYLLSHPTGNQNVRAVAAALCQSDLLAEFWTSIAFREDLTERLPAPMRAELERRVFRGIPANRLRTYPWFETARLLSLRLGLSLLTRHERGVFSTDQVLRLFDDHVSTAVTQLSEKDGGLQGVYTYEDSARATLAQASRLGLRRIYELPTGYWRAAKQIRDEESELQPEWASTLAGNLDSVEKLERKDRELELATDVVVASSFVKRTLEMYRGVPKKIHVLPYGAPATASGRTPTTPEKGQPLKALFVGNLNQQKGLSYLFDAMRIMVPGVELTVIGTLGVRCRALDRALEASRYLGSIPHAQVLKEMARHDVLVFPSLFDGFGLVILEAMSRGLPVIASTNSGGADVITDGKDGFIVPIRDSDAIVQCLTRLHDDRHLLEEMKENARLKALQRSWNDYGRDLRTMLGLEATIDA